MDATPASSPSAADYLSDRPCLRQPIPELFVAAAELDLAVGAHLAGDRHLAAEKLKSTNTQAVRDYIESMWGKRSLWPEQVHFLRHRTVDNLPKPTPEARGQKVSVATKRAVVQRDGFRCRYCSLYVIPDTVRKGLAQDYPNEVPWGATNASQHAAFQALWLQYDHIVPLSGGGANDPSNVVVTCAACNFLKWDYHLGELGLTDPRTRFPVTSCWDGLTRLFGGPEKCPL